MWITKYIQDVSYPIMTFNEKYVNDMYHALSTIYFLITN